MRRAGLAVVLLVALVACSRGGDGDVGEEFDVGAEIEVTHDTEAPTTTLAGSAATRPKAGLTATTSTSRAQGPANVSTLTDDSGFRLTLVVDGDLDYRANEDIALELIVRNVSSKPLHYDPNDERHFVIVPAGGATGRTWHDTDCRPTRPETVQGGAIVLEPGEEADFQATYPAKRVPGSPPRDDCRVPEGVYDVLGLITWCPPGTLRSDGTCDPKRNEPVGSAPVRMRIGPA